MGGGSAGPSRAARRCDRMWRRRSRRKFGVDRGVAGWLNILAWMCDGRTQRLVGARLTIGRTVVTLVRGPVVDPMSNGGEDAHARRAAISKRGEFGLGFVEEVGLWVVGAGITVAGVPLAETGVTVRPMGGR